MKCRYCESELKPGAKFCPNCGKEVLEFDVCINCGKQIKVGASFCPHCGKNQHEVNIEPEPSDEVIEIIEQPEEDFLVEQVQQEKSNPEPQEDIVAEPVHPFIEKQSSKKWIWILLVFLLIAILAGGGYYLLGNKDSGSSYIVETDSIAEIGESILSDVQSVEGVKARLTEILSKALKMYDEDAVNTYYSKEYRELFKKVKEYDNKYVHDEPGFWCGNIWDGGQDGNPTNFNIIKVSSSSNINAYAEVKLSYQVDEYHSENIVSMDLVFEDGNWFIDDVGGYKSSMKEYLSNSNEKKDIIDEYSKILDDFARKGKASADGNFYFLNDINGNGIPELWVQVCNDDKITCELLIYEYKDGTISKIYKEGLGHVAHHSFVTVKDCVCLAYDHMGSSSITRYEYKNGKIETTEIYSKESYDETDSDEPSSKGLETYEITDKKPLANI